MKKIFIVFCLLVIVGVWVVLQLIVYCGGIGDVLENILLVIKLVLENNVEVIWVMVQLSCDGVLVFYWLSDFFVLINSEGKVFSLIVVELVKVDVGWKWGDDSYLWCGKQVIILIL